MPFDSIIDILEVKACTNVEFLEKIKEHFIKEIQKKMIDFSLSGYYLKIEC